MVILPMIVTRNPMKSKRNGSKAFGPPENWLFCDNASGMMSPKNPSIKNNKKAIKVHNTKPNPVLANICRPLNVGGSKPNCTLLKLFGSFMIVRIDKVYGLQVIVLLMLFAVSLRISLEKLATEIAVISF